MLTRSAQDGARIDPPVASLQGISTLMGLRAGDHLGWTFGRSPPCLAPVTAAALVWRHLRPDVGPMPTKHRSTGALVNHPADPQPVDEVQVRTLLAGPMPLLVASVGSEGRSAELRESVSVAGLAPLSAFLGADLPQGAKVGFVVEGPELRLVDERDRVLLRAPRQGLDEAWLDRALAKKGTMFVVAEQLDLSAGEPAGQLVRLLDEQARSHGVIGAIVGVIEERPKLPLLF